MIIRIVVQTIFKEIPTACITDQHKWNVKCNILILRCNIVNKWRIHIFLIMEESDFHPQNNWKKSLETNLLTHHMQDNE